MTAWLRTDEAAYYLGTTTGAIHTLAHRHNWRRKRDGQRMLYAEPDVQAVKDRRLTTEGACT